MSEEHRWHSSMNDFDSGSDPVAERLASLEPRAHHLDRDRLMFLAGQTAAAQELSPPRPAIWRWRRAALMAATACAGFVAGLCVPTTAPAPRIVEATRPQAEPPKAAPLVAQSSSAGEIAELSSHAAARPIDLNRVLNAQGPGTLMALNHQVQSPWIEVEPPPPHGELSERLPAGYREMLRQYLEFPGRDSL